MTDPDKCDRCWGCGLIASSEDGEPWTMWLDLPLKSSLAVVMGIVRPLPCPKCAPRRGDLIETGCVACKAGRTGHSHDEARGHYDAGTRWLVQSVIVETNGRIKVYATLRDAAGTPTILEYEGPRGSIKIVKRREELVAETLMEEK